MKKLFIIALMLMYGLSSTGMTISLHYCCGKLDAISFAGGKEKSCGMPNHVEKSGCCNDKVIAASLTPDQQLASKWVQTINLNVATPFYPAITSSFKGQLVAANRLARGTPVPVLTLPLFIKNCVFRI